MHVQYKSVGNKSYSFDVNETDEISSVVSKLATEQNVDLSKSTFRVIFEGKIIQHTELFSQFKDKKSPFIFVVLKNQSAQPIQPAQISSTTQPQTTVPQQSPVNVQSNTTVTPNPPSPSSPSSQVDQTNTTNQPSQALPSIFSLPTNTEQNQTPQIDEVDKLRASLVGVLCFVRSNPQLAELFINNFEALLGILTAPQTKPLFEQIISDLESDANDSDFTDQLTDMLSNVQSFQLNNDNDNDNESTQSVKLNDEDMANIEILVSMGFSKNSCVQAYLVSNKNLDMAATFLMDN